MRMTNGSTCLLDPAAYPAILDMVIAHANNKTRVALWATNYALYQYLCSHFHRRVVHYCGGRGTHVRRGFPLMYRESEDRYEAYAEVCDKIIEYCRTVDLMTSCAAGSVEATLEFASMRGDPVTLRTWHTADLNNFDILPANIIFQMFCTAQENSEWFGTLWFLQDTFPNGPKQVVINVAYNWPNQLFASVINLKSLPPSVKEVVFHFKKVGSKERPRYMLSQAAFSSSDSEEDESYWVDSDEDDSEIDDIEFEGGDDSEEDSVGIFDFLGFVGPVSHQSSEWSMGEHDRSLRLTLVGLDEFDEERDKGAEGDAEFAEVMEQLPWGPRGTPEREDWAHFPYDPVATTFLHTVTKLVPKKKQGRVKSNVKIISSAEYLAQLDSQRRDEEDWWSTVQEDGGRCASGLNSRTCGEGLFNTWREEGLGERYRSE